MDPKIIKSRIKLSAEINDTAESADLMDFACNIETEFEIFPGQRKRGTERERAHLDFHVHQHEQCSITRSIVFIDW